MQVHCVSTYKLVCPHCNSRMRIRTSEGRHIFLRIAYLQCTNEPCGWSVRAEFEMTHELSPSGMPNRKCTCLRPARNCAGLRPWRVLKVVLLAKGWEAL